MDEQNEHSKRRDTALKVMRALFCDRDDFSSPGEIRRYLQSQHHDGVEAVLDVMLNRCQELLQDYSYTEGHPYLSRSADTGVDLEALIEPHIFEGPIEEEPALWPLVEHVRKGIKGSRILEHVELLDLPGKSAFVFGKSPSNLNLRDC